MQSWDSSCQEADFIINDTLKKLKGSSNSSLRQISHHQLQSVSLQQPEHQLLSTYSALQHQQQQQATQQSSSSIQQQQQHSHHSSLLHHHHHHHHQQQQQQQQQQQHQNPSSTLTTTTNLNQIHHQPTYIFDEVESPPDYSSLPTSISDHDFLASVGVGATDTHQQMSVLTDTLTSPNLLSINSIISPSPVVPDMILSTQSASTSPILNCSKSEKRSLILDNNNPNSNSLYNSSSPSKKVKLIDNIGSGSVTTSSSSSSSTTYVVGSTPLLQPFNSSGSSSNPSSTYNSNVFTSNTNHQRIRQQQQQQQQNPNATTTINTADLDPFKSNITIGYTIPSTSSTINLTTINNSNLQQGIPSSVLTTTTTTTSPHNIIINSNNSTTQASTTSSTSSTTTGAAATTLSPSTITETSTTSDIHDKIRELYLYLLFNDEKSLKESRKRHRTRSFVLERLVEREKLNTIVLNLYPGNEGYSLAIYQDDKPDDINDPLNMGANFSNTTNNYEGINFSSIQNDRGGGGGGGGGGSSSLSLLNTLNSSGHKIGTNASSSRLKQTQISSNNLNSSNINNNLLLSSSNNNLDIDDVIFDGTDGDISITAALDSFSDAIDNLSTASIDDAILNSNNNSNTIVTTYDDIDEDANLIEIMHWPYDVDDLLNSIDKEELPVLFKDLLETRTPNVFYSGCVICQVRDFRQTFPISSNSCDIYHVLLKPTNDTIYSDLNQLSIDSGISAEDKLLLESQLILATSEPLCLDPDPKIGRFAINNQHIRQMWNTSNIRRQMKKYTEVSINRKRKIDRFTHNYDFELSDYLQRVRQGSRSDVINDSYTLTPFVSGISINNQNNNMNNHSHSSSTSLNSNDSSKIVALSALHKLLKKPTDIIKQIGPPKLDYPTLKIPDVMNVKEHAKAYKKPEEMSKNCTPQLIEEYILETDREQGRVYHIKLSIFQRPTNLDYLGELYVDRDHQEGERNGEACQFSLGSRFHANRYIQQFKEIFTEEDRKCVKIIHNVPGQPPKVSYTSGMTERMKQKQLQQQRQQQLQQQRQQQQQQQQQQKQQQQQQQQQHQKQQHQVQQHSTQTSLKAAPQQTQQQQIHIQQSLQPTAQIITPTLNATTATALPSNQLNINLQGANIVGIATAGNVQQLRQQQQQIFEATGATVSVQTQPTQQINLGNGSLVLVQQQAPGSSVQTGLTIQNATAQQKAQILANAGQLTATTNAIRTQLGSTVPILQAQLKAAPLVTGQQQTIQQKTPTTIHSTNSTINAVIMNTTNQFQHQQQQQSQQQQVIVQSQSTQKTSNSAAILSFINSGSTAMTNSPVVSNTFNVTTAGGQQQQQQQQQQHQHQQQQQQSHQTISADTLIQQVQQPQQRKQNEYLLTNNLRKINMVSGNAGGNATIGVTGGGRSAGANLIAVSAVGLNPDNSGTQQNVRVTMSALAAQLASPPAVMTNTNFGYAAAAAAAAAAANNNNNNSIALNNNNNNNNIKIVNNTAQRVITANTLRRDSTATVAAPSPGSDSNASNASVTSNLGFTVPGYSALLATSPSPNSDQSQTGGSVGGSGGGNVVTSTLSNQALIERLNSGTNISTSPGLSPQQANVAKNIVQHVTNVQSPAASISPLSSPPSQPSPQQQQQQQQQQQTVQQATAQTTTLNLQGINLTSLQGAMATYPGLQNVQVQIPGLAQSISLSLAAAVQHQQQSGVGQQINAMQTVQGAGNCGTVVSVPATVAATQTVVLTNATAGVNSSTGSMLSLPIAQLVSGVKNLNAQTIRTAVTGPSNAQNVVNANIIQAAGKAGGNSGGNQPIQLLGAIQQRPRSIQVVSAKQIGNRGQMTSQRNITASTLKIAAPISASSQQITTTANITASPLVMTAQKLQLKLQKQVAVQQQQQQQQQQSSLQSQQQQHQQQQQQQQQAQQHIQMSGTQQRIMTATAIAVANQNQKRRRSATDLNK